MKNFNFFITVLALVIAMVASNNAVAQNVVNNISTNDAAACANHLRVHPLDTIVSSVQLSADTIQNTKVYLVDGVFSQQNFRREINYTVTKHVNRKVVDQKQLQAADTALINNQTQFFLSGANNDRQYDIVWVQCDELKKYREEMGDTLTYAGSIPVAWGKKYGFHVQASVGASLMKGNFSPVFGLGVLYDRAKWGALLEGEVLRTQLSSVASNAGQAYWTYGAQATVRYRPVQLDANDVNRLFVYGGVGFEWYKTDSRRDGDYYFTSHGNYLYGVFGIGYTHRLFTKAQDFGVSLEYHTSGSVRQNDTFEAYGTFVLKATYSFNVFPNKAHAKL